MPLKYRKPIDCTQVSHLTVEAGAEGQRLDNYLLKLLKGAPKSLIYRIIRKGEVRLNKKRAKPESRLHAGDLLRLPPVKDLTTKAPIAVPDALRKEILRAILFEDAHLIVLNKPAGLSVHSGSDTPYGAVERLRAAKPELRYLELVHRLDKATSGLLLFAKDRPTLEALHRKMRSHEGIDKRYLALVAGRWRYGDTKLSDRLVTERDRMRKSRVDSSGKEAISEVRVLSEAQVSTLLEIRLITGRMHQIRAQLSDRGHPILGDTRYGNKASIALTQARRLTRLCLHAHRLHFTLDNKDYTFHAPVPPCLA